VESGNAFNKRRDKRLSVKAFTEDEFDKVEKYHSCFNQTVYRDLFKSNEQTIFRSEAYQLISTVEIKIEINPD